MTKTNFDMDAALKQLREGKDLTGKDGILTPLIKQLTEAAMQTVDVRPEQVRVVIQETPLENYAVGGVTFAERQSSAGDGAMK